MTVPQITQYLQTPSKMQTSATSGYQLKKKPEKPGQQPFGIDFYEEEMVSKDKQIEELKQTIEIMDLKIKKLEQLLQLKDSKIEALMGTRNTYQRA